MIGSCIPELLLAQSQHNHADYARYAIENNKPNLDICLPDCEKARGFLDKYLTNPSAQMLRQMVGVNGILPSHIRVLSSSDEKELCGKLNKRYAETMIMNDLGTYLLDVVYYKGGGYYFVVIVKASDPSPEENEKPNRISIVEGFPRIVIYDENLSPIASGYTPKPIPTKYKDHFILPY